MQNNKSLSHLIYIFFADALVGTILMISAGIVGSLSSIIVILALTILTGSYFLYLILQGMRPNKCNNPPTANYLGISRLPRGKNSIVVRCLTNEPEQFEEVIVNKSNARNTYNVI